MLAITLSVYHPFHYFSSISGTKSDRIYSKYTPCSTKNHLHIKCIREERHLNHLPLFGYISVYFLYQINKSKSLENRNSAYTRRTTPSPSLTPSITIINIGKLCVRARRTNMHVCLLCLYTHTYIYTLCPGARTHTRQKSNNKSNTTWQNDRHTSTHVMLLLHTQTQPTSAKHGRTRQQMDEKYRKHISLNTSLYLYNIYTINVSLPTHHHHPPFKYTAQIQNKGLIKKVATQ